MKSKFTKDGYLVVASGCAEDNSGVVVQANGRFVLRMSYPIGITEDGQEVYEKSYSDYDLAITAFKQHLGSFGYGS